MFTLAHGFNLRSHGPITFGVCGSAVHHGGSVWQRKLRLTTWQPGSDKETGRATVYSGTQYCFH
jgi:hypothetical protein